MQTISEVKTPLPSLPPTKPRSTFGPILGGAILVLWGGLWTLDIAGVFEFEWAVLLPALLTVIGLALVIGAWSGPHSGPVVAGVFLSIAVVALAAFPVSSFNGGVGNRVFRVTEQTSLAPSYEVGVGDLTLDMSDLQMSESATVRVSAGAGNMAVILPPSVAVEVDGTVGAGEIRLLGERVDGLSVRSHFQTEGFDDANITLTLDLNVGAGRIEVTR